MADVPLPPKISELLDAETPADKLEVLAEELDEVFLELRAASDKALFDLYEIVRGSMLNVMQGVEDAEWDVEMARAMIRLSELVSARVDEILADPLRMIAMGDLIRHEGDLPGFEVPDFPPDDEESGAA